jgi:ZipA-like protein with FtsZ-binding domain
MTTSLFAALIAIVIIAIAVIIVRQKSAASSPIDESPRVIFGDVAVFPESVSKARAARAMPQGPSEDARALLVVPDIDNEEPASDNYPPNRDVDWVIDIEFPANTRLTKNQVQSLFDQPFLKSIGGATTYALCATTGKWTYVAAGDAPEPYSGAALAKTLTHYTGNDEPVAESELQRMLEAVKERSSRLPGAVVRADETPAQAAERSRHLVQLKRNCGQEIVLVLAASPQSNFDGRDIWDVMLCLGLPWGDMDLFHWRNPTDSGHDSFFSVWTTTPPGYFLPEEIAQGHGNTADLVFGYEPARCSAPLHVFDQMIAAVRYGQSRLGGRILDGTGHPANIDALKEEIAAIMRALEAANFPPGAESTLRLF